MALRTLAACDAAFPSPRYSSSQGLHLHFFALVLIEMYDEVVLLNTPRLGEAWVRVWAHVHPLLSEKGHMGRQAHQRGERRSSHTVKIPLSLLSFAAYLFYLLPVLFVALLCFFPLRQLVLSLLHTLWRRRLLSE